jgi:hypothetical protein
MATIQFSNLAMGFAPIAIAALKQNSAQRLFTQLQDGMIATACRACGYDAAGNYDRLLVDQQEDFANTAAFGTPMKKATFVAMDGLKMVC